MALYTLDRVLDTLGTRSLSRDGSQRSAPPRAFAYLLWNSLSPTPSSVAVAAAAVFTLEFVLRLACCPSIRKFVTTPLNIIDFVAIMPFYVELLLGDSVSGSSAVVRIFRLIRIFRIFKVSRYLPWVKVFANAMLLSLNPLLMLVFVILIATIVFSSAIYYAERGEWSDTAQAFMRDGNPPTISPYQSIPASMWWCIVTMTTVGYGDVTPITPAGRAIASFAALSGILVLAIPITVISTNFNSEYATLQVGRRARTHAFAPSVVRMKLHRFCAQDV